MLAGGMLQGSAVIVVAPRTRRASVAIGTMASFMISLRQARLALDARARLSDLQCGTLRRDDLVAAPRLNAGDSFVTIASISASSPSKAYSTSRPNVARLDSHRTTDDAKALAGEPKSQRRSNARVLRPLREAGEHDSRRRRLESRRELRREATQRRPARRQCARWSRVFPPGGRARAVRSAIATVDGRFARSHGVRSSAIAIARTSTWTSRVSAAPRRRRVREGRFGEGIGLGQSRFVQRSRSCSAGPRLRVDDDEWPLFQLVRRDGPGDVGDRIDPGRDRALSSAFSSDSRSSRRNSHPATKPNPPSIGFPTFPACAWRVERGVPFPVERELVLEAGANLVVEGFESAHRSSSSACEVARLPRSSPGDAATTIGAATSFAREPLRA